MIEFLNIQKRIQDQELKRRAFDASVRELRHVVGEKTKPQMLLMGLFAGGSVLKMVIGKKGSGLKKIMSLAAPFILKKLISSLTRKRSA